ncbi:putative formin-like protein 20 [Iris pallida]|uniref:Formin-like protein 20 n=1 Tax=Iris pallida TaxID=29817 RepID=A0AAX6FC84_IRIPA|nr:putative formin-like protein 20 [Iris pallida]
MRQRRRSIGADAATSGGGGEGTTWWRRRREHPQRKRWPCSEESAGERGCPDMGRNLLSSRRWRSRRNTGNHCRASHARTQRAKRGMTWGVRLLY